MGLDLQKWNPFRFSGGRAEARPNAGGAAPQERPGADGLASRRDSSRPSIPSGC
jgi:hypothetical protein